MATRLYFSAAASTSGLTPSFDAGWNYNSEALRRDLLRAKSAGESLTIGTQIGPWTATAGQTALDRQFISAPLAAQTISGTFAGQVMAREYATTDNVDQLYVAVKVINSSGTVVATLYALGNATTTLEFISNVSHRNKRIADGDALTSYACASGDRLLVEIGYRNSTAATTPEASAKWGAPSSGTDLPQNETQTTDGVGWIELSGNLAWLYTATVSGGVTLSGVASTLKNSVFTASVSGGATLFGSATTSHLAVNTYSPSGGATLSGSATTSYEAASGSTFTYSPSGGVVLAGSAAIARTITAQVSGGVTLSGTASTTRTFARSGTGSVTLAGAATTARVVVQTALVSGGITLAGAAGIAKGRVFAPSGGITLSGAATLARTRAIATTGGVTLSGAAATSLVLAGAATEYPYTGSGGIEFGGVAATSRVSATAYEVTPDFMGSHFVAPLIELDRTPPPVKWTYSYSGKKRVGLAGTAVSALVSVKHYQYFGQAFIAPRWAGTYSRSFAAPQGVSIASQAKRKRQAEQDEIALLALV